MMTRTLMHDDGDMLVIGSPCPGETELLEVIQIIDDEPSTLMLTVEEARFLRDQVTAWLEEEV